MSAAVDFLAFVNAAATCATSERNGERTGAADRIGVRRRRRKTRRRRRKAREIMCARFNVSHATPNARATAHTGRSLRAAARTSIARLVACHHSPARFHRTQRTIGGREPRGRLLHECCSWGCNVRSGLCPEQVRGPGPGRSVTGRFTAACTCTSISDRAHSCSQTRT